MTHACLFVGGPLDGEVRALQPMNHPYGHPLHGLPPEDVVLSGLGETLVSQANRIVNPHEVPVVRYFRYVRKVNPCDDGPLWIYVPAPEYADRPEPWDPRHPDQGWRSTITFEDFQRERRGTWPPREPRRER